MVVFHLLYVYFHRKKAIAFEEKLIRLELDVFGTEIRRVNIQGSFLGSLWGLVFKDFSVSVSEINKVVSYINNLLGLREW